MNRSTAQIHTRMCKSADNVNKILDRLSLTSCVYIVNDEIRATG
jgi:hypothetical protein